MPRSKKVQNKKPTWQVHARKIDAADDPWTIKKIEARSVLQAEAILRRLGYEMNMDTAVQVAEPGEPVPPLTLEPLKCASCGYGLSGLTIRDASVICPECSYPQPLIVWSRDLTNRHKKTHPLVVLFAGIGMFVTGIILLSIVLPILLRSL
jgi:predicted Zn-ribbon and HTH transcriptional regulator